MIAPADTAPGRHFCHACGAETVWREVRGVQRCDGCRGRFPCRSKRCGHTDCEAHRAEVATPAAGV